MQCIWIGTSSGRACESWSQTNAEFFEAHTGSDPCCQMLYTSVLGLAQVGSPKGLSCPVDV